MRSYFAMALLGAMSLAEETAADPTSRDPIIEDSNGEFKNVHWFSGPQLLAEDDQKLYAGGRVAWVTTKVQDTDEDGNDIQVDALVVYQTIGVNIVTEYIVNEEDNKVMIPTTLDEKAVIDVAFCGFDDAMESNVYKCMGAKFDRNEKKTKTFMWAGKQVENETFQPNIPMGADLYSQLNVDSEPELTNFSHYGMYEIVGADITASVIAEDDALQLGYGIKKSATKQDWNDYLEVTFVLVSKDEEAIKAYKEGKPKNTGYMFIQYQELDDESVNMLSVVPAVQQAAAEGKTGGDSSWFDEFNLPDGKNGAGHLAASALAFMLVSTLAF